MAEPALDSDPVVEPEAPPSEPAPTVVPAEPSGGPSFWRGVRRVLRGVFVAGVAVLGAAIVAGLSVDLGPSLKKRAEAAASKQIERPFRMGGLSVKLLTGDFVVEDVEIDGLHEGDRPFFKAKSVVLDVPWWSILQRDLIVRSVQLTDWDMLVETHPDGRHNFPKFTSDKPRTGPRVFTTTVQSVRAGRGRFTYEDHEGSTWSVTAPNIDIVITKLSQYRGTASFSGGSVQILSFLPMWADMSCSFTIDKGHIVIDDMALETDGGVTAVASDVDMGAWPEQTHRVHSVLQFPRMREIFWADQTFSLGGQGTFDGVFHLFKGGHDLRGTFAGDGARLDDLAFPNLRGALAWTPSAFEVTDTSADFYGGHTRLAFAMRPLGQPTPGVARFDADYSSVDLLTLTHAIQLPGMRLAGQATGRNVLEWPIGAIAEKHGEGRIEVTPPPGVVTMSKDLPPALLAVLRGQPPTSGAAFDKTPLRAPLPVGGHLAYRYDPEWITVDESAMASPRTYVEFRGRTAYGDRSELPFHVTSADWQESDRVLASIMTAFGTPTGAVPFGGHGTFDGVMLNAFKKPRVEGRFAGDDVRAWDVVWGRIEAGVQIENAYADIENGVVTRDGSRIDASGRFSLGYPRPDGAEEINTRLRFTDRVVADLRHAFDIDDYPVDGALSGEFHVYGRYEHPLGFGRVTIAPGVAYREPFTRAEAGVQLEGEGVRFEGLEIASAGGTVTGAAYVAFDGTYSFEASGRGIPVETIAAVQRTELPLSGLFRFSAFGKGRFASPRYDVRAAIDDFFIADEGIGQVTGRLGVRDNALVIEQLDVASPRLTASGAGRIALTDTAEADLTLRFSDASLDPYARLYQPKLSPFTTAVASGTARLRGPLYRPEEVTAEANVERLNFQLFDYGLRNDGPVRLTMDGGRMRVARMRLVGEGTALEVAGDATLKTEHLDVRAKGDTSLSILQGFMRDIRSAGRASLAAEVGGTIHEPVINGSLSIADGRLRHFALPHSIEELNGTVEFNAGGVSFEGLKGRLGGGPVTFGGSVLFQGFLPNEFSLTATGTDMRLRYPEGFRSTVDADLALRGDVTSPVLSGTVTVRDALFVKAFDTSGAGVFNFGGGSAAGTVAPAQPADQAFPVRFDLRIDAPSTLRIENGATRLVSSASLTLAGTYDQPRLLGRAEIDRGDILFEGHRYLVTRGSIDFANPNRIEPFLDIEAETRARVPGETYLVTFRVSGTADRLKFDVSSDPPLAEVDILALLFGDSRDTQNPELRALQRPEYAQRELVYARAARLLASPLSSGVGKAVEQALGVDSVQITPSLGDISSQQLSRLNPGARLTLSKRISERMLLTLSRTLTSSAPEQVILLEYNQSDRLSWVLTQNEDRTYAVDVRVRRVF